MVNWPLAFVINEGLPNLTYTHQIRIKVHLERRTRLVKRKHAAMVNVDGSTISEANPLSSHARAKCDSELYVGVLCKML